jgi:adenylate cyclase
MQCDSCRVDNPASNRFCQQCGASLFLLCDSCRHPSPRGASFCGACGAALAPIRPKAAATPEPRAAKLPARVELKQVTVLFADLVSSTEMVARLGPEEAMGRLEPALDAMCDAVERFGGTVVRTLGDGIMALFGAPRTLEGHALHACQAALAIRDAFAPGRGGLAIRVGLHSGEIVADAPVGNSVSERSVHGMTIHLASRLPALVEPGGICMSADSYRLTQSFCQATPLGPHRLRGVPEEMQLYQLRGLRSAVASQQFRGVALTRFHGREREMAILQERLRGGPRVICVVGAPGTGKSRLCYQFAERCRSLMIPVFEARAQPHGAATPLAPILEFFRNAYFVITPDDDAETAVRVIAQRLAELGPFFEGDLPLICNFLGVPYREQVPVWLNPSTRNARLLQIMRQLVLQRGVTPSVIIIEDLHWLDEASEKFVAALVEAVAATKTLLLLNCRPSYAADWMQSAGYQQIDLADLDAEATVTLVDELVGLHPDTQDVRRRIAERSAGNPFFAEELVRSLAEHLTFLGEQGNYRLGLDADIGVLPATVQAVIGARIDRLAAAERDLLQIGAIIGKEFHAEILRRVAERSDAEVDAILARLCAGEMLQQLTAHDGEIYAFRHPLIQEVAYASQLKARRGPVHAAVAGAMEQFHRERIDEFSGLLSHHFEQAGQLGPAARYAARAARWVGTTNSKQAIRHWEKVRALMASQPFTRDDIVLRIDASSQIAWLGWREGQTSEEAQPFIAEAIGWARQIDDSVIPLLLFVEGRIAGASGGNADTYVERVRDALALTVPGRDDGRIATLNASLSQAYGWAGLLREALAANDIALAGVAEIDSYDQQFLGYSVEEWSQSLRGRILVRLGRFEEARACFEHVLGIDQRLINPTVQFIANLGYVDLAWCLDDSEMAREHAARVAAAAARHNIPYLRAYSLACDGTAASIARDYRQGIASFREGIDFVRSARVAMEFETEMLASMADCHCRQGEFAEAIRTAEEAITVARQRSARLAECRASITLGTALLHTGGPGAEREARLHFDQARGLIAVSGAAVLIRLLDEAEALPGRVTPPAVTPASRAR